MNGLIPLIKPIIVIASVITLNLNNLLAAAKLFFFLPPYRCRGSLLSSSSRLSPDFAFSILSHTSDNQSTPNSLPGSCQVVNYAPEEPND